VAKAARRPIEGQDKVARFLVGIAQQGTGLDVRFALINGTVGIVGYAGDDPTLVVLLDTEGSRVDNVFLIVNPHKLAHLHR
jgi:RNA polymerase sigma-70 factor (ECF subfamily)